MNTLAWTVATVATTALGYLLWTGYTGDAYTIIAWSVWGLALFSFAMGIVQLIVDLSTDAAFTDAAFIELRPSTQLALVVTLASIGVMIYAAANPQVP